MSAKEPTICDDCGIDTTPCTGKRGCRHKGKWEWYMVWPELWEQAGSARYLCIGCLEQRLGRRLFAEDFNPDLPVNWLSPWNTPRLDNRLTTFMEDELVEYRRRYGPLEV
jgi:hypothetical protein